MASALTLLALFIARRSFQRILGPRAWASPLRSYSSRRSHICVEERLHLPTLAGSSTLFLSALLRSMFQSSGSRSQRSVNFLVFIGRERRDLLTVVKRRPRDFLLKKLARYLAMKLWFTSQTSRSRTELSLTRRVTVLLRAWLADLPRALLLRRSRAWPSVQQVAPKPLCINDN